MNIRLTALAAAAVITVVSIALGFDAAAAPSAGTSAELTTAASTVLHDEASGDWAAFQKDAGCIFSPDALVALGQWGSVPQRAAAATVVKSASVNGSTGTVVTSGTEAETVTWTYQAGRWQSAASDCEYLA
jgi:hypothetical protein